MANFINTIDLLGDDVVFESLISRQITEYNDDVLTALPGYAMSECMGFLKKVKFPSVKSIGERAMQHCNVLQYADFGSVESIGVLAFRNSPAFGALIVRTTGKVASLVASDAFSNTKIKSGTGYVYVPRALVDSYKVATNWSTIADQIRALEDYTVDGTITGELDETKI